MLSLVGWIESRVIGSIGSIGGSAGTCGVKSGANVVLLTRDSRTTGSGVDGAGNAVGATGSIAGFVTATVVSTGVAGRCHGCPITIAMTMAAAAAANTHVAYGARRASICAMTRARNAGDGSPLVTSAAT